MTAIKKIRSHIYNRRYTIGEDDFLLQFDFSIDTNIH